MSYLSLFIFSLSLLCLLSMLPPRLISPCCCPLFPSILFPLHLFTSISPLAAHAVEIKVIKDLPWPPPVGQLNTSPPLAEELESPSPTAQPSPGQTGCDQHHHGGCWCSHCPANSPLFTPRPPPHLSLHPSIHQILRFLWGMAHSVKIYRTHCMCCFSLTCF